ncbi:MAG TPA: hypothetical protein VL442_19435 [Mucilaginibacter sp.]|jgi:hypothetical protein|nr:hypothetical protein [Mucilaginibacter sp.]
MKKNLLLVAAFALLFTACKKQTDEIKPVSLTNDLKTSLAPSPTILVDTIIRYDPSSPNGPTPYSDFLYNYFITTFKYTGKLLTSTETGLVRQYVSDLYPSVHTNFYYNDNNQLTNTTMVFASKVPDHPEDIRSSKVSYSNGHIATIDFIRQDGATDKKFSLTYTDNLLTEIFEPNAIKINYEYDAKGNNIKEIDQPYKSGVPYLTPTVIETSSFDDKPNFQKALPLWVYFKCYDIEMSSHISAIFNFTVLQKSFTNTPGANNPLTISTNGNPSAFTYKYFDNGYPSRICDLSYIWRYSYITVQ